jgi:hypothetical protein
MATLNLTKVFVNLVSTGAAVSGVSARDRAEDYTIPGETRTYAGGRRRAITQAGELGTYKFQLMLISRASVDTLRSWQGQTVQVRDNKGRRFFGVFYGVSVVEIVSRSTWHVSIELSVVTQTEGV